MPVRNIKTTSGPGRENLLGLRDLFHRTGEADFVFPGFAGDVDLDGFQAAVLHPQTELFKDFLDAVLLEAFAHDRVSVRDSHKAMLIAAYFGKSQINQTGTIHPTVERGMKIK